MTVSQLYSLTCPVCRMPFTCVSKSARYCSDKCRNAAYRRRKQLARDGRIKGVSRLWDHALAAIEKNSATSYTTIQNMTLYSCGSWAIKSAIMAVYQCLWVNDMSEGSFEYVSWLHTDLAVRHQLEMDKFIFTDIDDEI